VPISLMGDVEIQAPRIEWESGTIDVTADEALQAAADDMEDRGAKADAIDFLRAELEYGRVEADEILKRGRKAGHSERTLKRAKAELKITSKRESHVWYWSLPKRAAAADSKDANPPQGCQPQTAWHPYETPSVSADFGSKTPPETPKGANTVSLAPLAPLTDVENKNSPENDKPDSWSVEI